MTDNPNHVTPEEANRKKCVYVNDARRGTWEYYCQADACMAWRWKHTIHFKTGAFGFNITENRDEYSTTHGYCGMVRP